MEKSLDELYEEVAGYAFKFKPDLKKTIISCAPTILSSAHPIFYLSLIPSLAYLVKTTSDLFNVISKISIHKEENIYNSLEYLKYEKNYFLLIGKLQKMLKDIDIKEPMEIFATYYYLVLNGYLSVNHVFYNDNIDSLPFNFESSIFSGVGVCRNLSPLLTDLLKQFNYDAYNIQMFVQNQAILKLSEDNFNRHEMDEDIEDKVIILSDIFKKLIGKSKINYNHISTLLANGDESYIMDPMNNTFYLIEKGIVYPYRNCKEPLITELSEEWSFRRKVEIPYVDSSNIGNSKKLEMQYMNSRKKCDDCIDIFEQFHRQNKELYSELLENNDEFSKKYVKIRDLLKQMV